MKIKVKLIVKSIEDREKEAKDIKFLPNFVANRKDEDFNGFGLLRRIDSDDFAYLDQLLGLRAE